MENSAHREEEYKLWWLLCQTRDATHAARTKELRQYGISSTEAGVLFILKSGHKNMTPAELARWLLRKPHSVTGLLSRMEKKGLVKKTKDLSRKNMIRVTITEKGEQAYSVSLKRDSLHAIMSSLTKESLQQIMSSLYILRASALEGTGWKEELPFP